MMGCAVNMLPLAPPPPHFDRLDKRKGGAGAVSSAAHARPTRPSRLEQPLQVEAGNVVVRILRQHTEEKKKKESPGV